MTRIGVSGLTGMIGKNLINSFTRDPDLGAGLELVAFTRQQTDISFLQRSGIEHRRIDYGDPESFRGKVEDLDAFLHMAGLTKAVSPAGYYRVNVEGTARLIEALDRYGTKIKHFLFVSSTSASGPAGSPKYPKTEEDPCTPVSHYGKSKLQAEAVVRSCSLPWTIVRLPIVFGPYDWDMLAMFRIAKNGFVTLFTAESDPYTYVSAPDAGRFFLQAIRDERLFGEVYCYCYDTALSGAEFFPMVRRQLGLPEAYRYIQVPRWVEHPARLILDLKHRITGRATIVNPDKIAELARTYWIFSNRKLKTALGIKTIKNGGAVTQTVQWYQDHHLL